MAGAFSGHLINSFSQANSFCSPFGHTQDPSNISISGAMSFNRQMHGTFPSQPSFCDNSSSMDLSESTVLKIAELQAKLDRKLGPEFISTRPGPAGGPKLTYAEGWKIINLANDVFGFNGWSSSIVSLTTDFIDYSEESKRFTVGVTAIVRITLRDGVYHEDIGYGMLENSKSKGAALDKCKKEAVTDGVKRALRNFGNLLGNCLYDKSYTQEVVKMKVPPAKFDKEDLYRRPEFAEQSTSTPNQPSTSKPPQPQQQQQQQQQQARVQPVAQGQPQTKPVPSHLPAGGPTANNTPQNAKGKEPARAPNQKLLDSVRDALANPPPTTGLSTPVQTPAHPQHAQQRSTADSHKPPPQAQQLPRDRHVSFASSSVAPQAPQQKVELPLADDSFTFNSDDDAFMAAIDLGIGEGNDLVSEKASGPSDFTSATNEVKTGARVVTNARQAAPGQVPPQAGGLRTAQPANTNASASGSNLSTFAVASNFGQNQTRAPIVQRVNNDNSSGLGSTRPLPSTDGAHHPSNMHPPSVLRQKQPQQPYQQPNSGQHQQQQQYQRRPGDGQPPPPSGIGLKRSADATGSMYPAKRPAPGPGMGLSGSGRQPLSNLEIGDGGDVKRMRR